MDVEFLKNNNMFKKLEVIETFSEYTQKFPRGSIVNVDSLVGTVMESYREGFPFSSFNEEKYQILFLDDSGIPAYDLAWIKVEDITLISNDVCYGNKLIDYYKHTKIIKEVKDSNN